MRKSLASLNHSQNTTPKSRSRKTIFNIDDSRVNPTSSSNNSTSNSELLVVEQKNETKPTETIDVRCKLNNEFSPPVKDTVVCTPKNKKWEMVMLNSPYCKPTREQLRQYMNSSSAFLQIKARQAINYPEQFITESDSDDEIERLRAQAPKPVENENEILTGVVAYVELHHEQNDYSEGAKDMLQRLGATVRDTFLKDVTHVLFRQGRVSTYKKAKERKIPLLSVNWIEACRMQKYKVCETRYPSSGLDQYEIMALLNKRSKPVRRVGMSLVDKPKKTRSQKPSASTSKTLNVTVEDKALDKAVEDRALCKTVDDQVLSATSTNDETMSNAEAENPAVTKPQKTDLVTTLRNTVIRLNLDLSLLDVTKSPEKRDIFDPPEHLVTRLMRKFMALRDAETDDESDKENKSMNNIQSPNDNQISDVLSKISIADSEDKNNLGIINKSTSECPKVITNKDSTTLDSFSSLQLPFNPVTPVKKKRRISFKPSVEKANISSSLNREDSTGSSLRLHISSSSEDSKTTFCSNESIPNTSQTRSETKGTDEILEEINTAVCSVISDRKKSMRCALSKNVISNVESDKDSQIRRNSPKTTLDNKIESNSYLVDRSLNEAKPSNCTKSEETSNEVEIMSPITPRVTSGANKNNSPVISKITLNGAKIPFNFKKISNERKFTPDGIPITPDLVQAYSARKSISGPSVYDIVQTDDIPYFLNPVSKKPVETDPNTLKKIRKRKLYSMHAMNDTSMMNLSLVEQNDKKNNALDPYFQTSAVEPDVRKIKHAKRVLSKNQNLDQTNIKSYFAESNSGTSQVLSDSLLKNLSAITPARRSTLEFQEKPTKEQLKLKALKKVTAKRSTNIVCTSLHKEQIEMVKNTIKKLGGYIYFENVCSSTSHIVSLEPRRTLSLLKGIARGCWIISLDWVTKSNEAGKWLDEDLFEWTSFSPAIQRARIERQAFGDSYKMDIFSISGAIYISKKCSPPWRQLQELVTLCSGKLVLSYRLADIIVGETFENHLCVSPNWILDSITDYKVKSVNPYIIHGNV